MSRLNDTVSRMIAETGRLADLVSSIKGKLTKEEIEQFGVIRRNLSDEIQNMMGINSHIHRAYDSLQDLCLPK